MRRRRDRQQLARAAGRGRAVALATAAVLAAGGIGALTGLASASATTLGTASNALLGKTIVVSSKGVTVYELKPETSHHLLCKNLLCYAAWPPLTVRSAKAKVTAAAGVKGKLGILKRKIGPHRFFQVTLAGHPLYKFSGDAGAPGAATGDGFHSFGGTWHVVSATA